MIIHNPYIPGIDKIFFDVQSSNRQNVQFEKQCITYMPIVGRTPTKSMLISKLKHGAYNASII